MSAAPENKTPEVRRYILKLSQTAGVLRRHDYAARNLDPAYQAGLFLEQLKEIFGDRLVSSKVLTPSDDKYPRVEVECLPSDIAQIRCFFAPKISRVDEVSPPLANDNQKSFWKRFSPFKPR